MLRASWNYSGPEITGAPQPFARGVDGVGSRCEEGMTMVCHERNQEQFCIGCLDVIGKCSWPMAETCMMQRVHTHTV